MESPASSSVHEEEAGTGRLAIGLLNSFRMMRLPDIAPSATLEGTTLG
jgi:hypothetical protein